MPPISRPIGSALDDVGRRATLVPGVRPPGAGRLCVRTTGPEARLQCRNTAARRMTDAQCGGQSALRFNGSPVGSCPKLLIRVAQEPRSRFDPGTVDWPARSRCSHISEPVALEIAGRWSEPAGGQTICRSLDSDRSGRQAPRRDKHTVRSFPRSRCKDRSAPAGRRRLADYFFDLDRFTSLIRRLEMLLGIPCPRK